MKVNKRGSTQAIQGIAVAIIVLSILIGVGNLVIMRMGGQTAVCTADKTYNYTTELCANATGTATPTGSWTTFSYFSTQLGSSGLAGWVPAIIALTIGIAFLSYFIGRKTKE